MPGLASDAGVAALQFTVNDTVAEPPAGTVTLCGFGLVTVQFVGTADSVTV